MSFTDPNDSTPHLTSREGVLHEIVETVAAAEGVDPTDLPPLYTVIDPDALSALVHSPSTDVTVEFTYFGYRIVVHDDDDIHVSDRNECY